MRCRSTKAVVLALLLGSILPLYAQRGAISKPRDLDQMTREAATIIHGRVLLARVERHPQLTHLRTVVVVVRVREVLKGQAGRTFSFRQFIWDARDRADAAGYSKGQELLLLMSAPSSLGLSSPIGAGQGRFRITPDERGTPMAVNSVGNIALFGDAAAQARYRARLPARLALLVQEHRRGPVALDDLRELVRRLGEAPR